MGKGARTGGPRRLLQRLRRRPDQVVDYAQRTYDSPNFLVRFAHQQRFASALRELRATQPEVVVDYGAGDGHLIGLMLEDSALRDAHVIAFEPIEEFRDRINEGTRGAGSVETVAEASALDGRHADIVLLLGVLEHLPADERAAIYRRVSTLVGPEGVVLVGVPVESGLPLLLKNLGRRLLKGDTVDGSFRETLRGVLGGIRFDPRRHLPGYPAAYFLHHRGFDHRLLAAELAVPFDIERRWSTPVPWLPALLAGHEMYFRLRPRTTWTDGDPSVLSAPG